MSTCSRARHLAALWVVLACGPGAGAATITVTGVGDAVAIDGQVTLREAITSINGGASVTDVTAVGAYGSGDRIEFALGGGGPQTIATGTTTGLPLPTITEPVVIDGYSQSGSSPNTLAVGNDAVLNLVLQGTVLGAHGLTVGPGGDGTEIRGIVFQKHFFAVQIQAANVIVAGCFIGTDRTATAADANTGNGVGVNVTIGAFGGNVIGGAAPADRNVISGNGTGVVLNSDGSNSVLGNYIGLNGAGTAALANGGDGIYVGSIGAATVGGPVVGGVTAVPGQGAGNVIAGNGSSGIRIQTTGLPTVIGPGSVQGNILGLDATGVTAIPNTGANVYLYDTALPSSGVPRLGPITIGGAVAGAGNVLASGGHGIYNLAAGTVIQGNRIGTDITGTLARPNTFGIELTGSGAFVASATIGGTGADEGNVIAGNLSDAVRVFLATATIQGNAIGVGATGGNLANGGYAIFVDSGLANIGGVVPGAGNVIANAGDHAVQVRIGFPAVRNASEAAILGNSIRNSAFLGINNSAPDVVTPNDPGDADSGPNDLQNFPVLTAATIVGGNVEVSGLLDSTPSGVFRVELFANPACDSFGHGEGTSFLGGFDVTTDALGSATFGPVSLPVPVGQAVITATATNAANHTSELSACLTATVPPPPSLSVDDCLVTEGDAGTVNCTFTVTADAPSGATMTVDYQTANLTAFAPGDYTTTMGTLTFLPGQLSKTVDVPVVGDIVDEPDEDFALGLSSPTNATVGDGVGSGVILDDDPPVGTVPIFADGFESGDTTAWSATVP